VEILGLAVGTIETEEGTKKKEHILIGKSDWNGMEEWIWNGVTSRDVLRIVKRLRDSS
jgi:hypothetical protein